MPLVDYTVIRVSLPLEGHKQTDLLGSVINLLKLSQPIGCVGNYAAVYELTDAQEGFSPLANSNPTKGTVGEDETCKAQLLTTYAPASVSQQQILEFADKLVELHPWEHPVIEIINSGRTQIWMPK